MEIEKEKITRWVPEIVARDIFSHPELVPGMSVPGDAPAPDADSAEGASSQQSEEIVTGETLRSPAQHIRALIDGLRKEGDSIEPSEVRSNALHLLHT